MKIEHIGIVTKSIKKKKKELSLVLKWKSESPVYDVKSQKVRTQFINFENLSFELIEPKTKDSPISKFLEKKGEGLHHITFLVDDGKKTYKRFKRKGLRIAQEPWEGEAHQGRLVFFLHPKSTSGILMEFVQEKEKKKLDINLS